MASNPPRKSSDFVSPGSVKGENWWVTFGVEEAIETRNKSQLLLFLLAACFRFSLFRRLYDSIWSRVSIGGTASKCWFFFHNRYFFATLHRGRRYYGFETRSAESGGPAADRAKVKTIFKEGKANKAGLKDYEVRVKRCGLWCNGIFSLLSRVIYLRGVFHSWWVYEFHIGLRLIPVHVNDNKVLQV